MKILAIETSCDETAISLNEAKGGLKKPSFNILENLVASQIKIHQPFGGVVPNLAKREHLRNLPILYGKIKEKDLKNLDLIAVTVGPGLEPALWAGIEFSKDVYKKLKNKNKKLKILGISHLEGHLYSNLLQVKNKNTELKDLFPAIGLIVSGGHTTLLLMKDLGHWKKLGETRDDAVGEAFDKVARLLNLPYPGGPEIEKLAKLGDGKAINFPRPMIEQKNFDFSFSGLKTSILYFLRDNKQAKKEDIAASFQEAAFDVLIKKTLRACEEFGVKSIFVSGGVAANKTLKKHFKKLIKEKFEKKEAPKLMVTKFPTDNAAMIGVAAYFSFLRNKNRKLRANGNLSI